MYAVSALALAVWLFVALASVGAANVATAKKLATIVQASDVRELVSRTQDFVNETGGVPVSMDALVKTPGYEDLRTRLPITSDVYKIATGFPAGPAGFATYDRAMFLIPDGRVVGQQVPWSKGACGDKSATSSSWCGTTERGWTWAAVNTIDTSIARDLSTEMSLHHLLSLFASTYRTPQKFPSLSGLGKAVSLPAYFGVTSPQACVGTYVIAGAPIDCSDLFDGYGNGIGYIPSSAKHITVFAVSTPSLNSAVLALDMNLDYIQ